MMNSGFGRHQYSYTTAGTPPKLVSAFNICSLARSRNDRSSCGLDTNRFAVAPELGIRTLVQIVDPTDTIFNNFGYFGDGVLATDPDAMDDMAMGESRRMFGTCCDRRCIRFYGQVHPGFAG